MNETETKPSEDDEQPELISLKTFLETVPPGHERFLVDYYYEKSNSSYLAETRLWLHCPSEECDGDRYFHPMWSKRYLKITEHSNQFLTFACSNCGKHFKRYSVSLFARGVHQPGRAIKYGEVPSFGPPVPNRLLRLLEEDGDKELFLKGRQCENQGLGVGAFSYYRRVVENKKVALIKEIIKVAETVNAPKEAKDALTAALKENQFKTSIEMIKDAIPETLLINGHNPMALLYAALSDGLHDRDDDHCLELAASIRVVLSDLVQKVANARREDEELKAALAKLTTKKASD